MEPGATRREGSAQTVVWRSVGTPTFLKGNGTTEVAL
jgi:hypothetical protein